LEIEELDDVVESRAPIDGDTGSREKLRQLGAQLERAWATLKWNKYFIVIRSIISYLWWD
jgi:hypothetical protein